MLLNVGHCNQGCLQLRVQEYVGVLRCSHVLDKKKRGLWSAKGNMLISIMAALVSSGWWCFMGEDSKAPDQNCKWWRVEANWGRWNGGGQLWGECRGGGHNVYVHFSKKTVRKLTFMLFFSILLTCTWISMWHSSDHDGQHFNRSTNRCSSNFSNILFIPLLLVNSQPQRLQEPPHQGL